MATFDAFYESLILRGLEHFRKYYGLYRGTVTRNDDPERRGRIQAKVLQVGHTRAPAVWIDPAFEGAGTSRGFFWPPEVGDSVRVGFEHGNPSTPIVYFGGWFGGEDLPSNFSYTSGQKVAGQTGTASVPERRGLVTRKGHRITFSDEDGKETVELTWHKRSSSDASVTADSNGDRTKSADQTKGDTSTLVFNSDGDIVLTNKNGSKVTLGAKNKNITVRDENNNVITLDKNGVTIESKKVVIKSNNIEVGEGADSVILRGSEFSSYITTHTHGTAWGPSTVPIQPIPENAKSRVAKVK